MHILFTSTEEILATYSALWWAPNGEYLLIARFNDSVVQNFEFPHYGSYLDPSKNQYTTIDVIAYPKVHFESCMVM